MNGTLGRAFLFWLPLPFIGTLNGIFRGVVIQHVMSELHAKQVSSVILIILITLYTLIVMPRLRLKSVTDAWVVGASWMVLTILFEFALGTLVSKNSFSELLSEYKLWEGKLWLLVILAILVMPVLLFKPFASERNSLSS